MDNGTAARSNRLGAHIRLGAAAATRGRLSAASASSRRCWPPSCARRERRPDPPGTDPWLVGVVFPCGVAITAWNAVAVLAATTRARRYAWRVASVARLLAWGTQPLGALLGKQ